jgi:hypothetical protein
MLVHSLPKYQVPWPLSDQPTTRWDLVLGNGKVCLCWTCIIVSGTSVYASLISPELPTEKKILYLIAMYLIPWECSTLNVSSPASSLTNKHTAWWPTIRCAC